jgi:hypothetical protein
MELSLVVSEWMSDWVRHPGCNDKYCYLVLCSSLGTISYTHAALKYAVFVRKLSITECLLWGTERRLKKEFSIQHIIQNGTSRWHTVNINTSKLNIYRMKYVTKTRTNSTYVRKLMWLSLLHSQPHYVHRLLTEISPRQSINTGSTWSH